jgi:hypothetical protein
MNKTLKLLSALMTMILMSSFTNNKYNEFTGTYGVSSSDPAQIKLIINSDHTFYYQDFSHPGKKIVIHGNWITRGKKVILKDNASGKHFHKVWTFVENGQIARSRKGLCFYRLCKIDDGKN